MLGSLHRFVHVEHVWGTAVSLDVRGPAPAAPAVEDTVRWFHDVDARFSPYRPDSEISRFGRGELAFRDLERDARWVVERCEGLRRETAGFFDARAAGGFDPSALVKGWAVERAADGLAIAGVRDLCLTAGGDVATRGEARPGEPWRVGIQHPLDRHALAAVVELREDTAVATSGLYERGDHIVDPHTGRTPSDVLSVTVTGPDLGTADAYATAAFAMGARGTEWTLGLPGYEAMTVLADETVLLTPGFPKAAA